MSSSHGIWSREPFPRLGGGLLFTIGLSAMRWLFRSAAPGVPLDPSALQFVAAGAGFLGMTLGAALLALGVHIFDQVELSERWKHQAVPARSNISPQMLSPDGDPMTEQGRPCSAYR